MYEISGGVTIKLCLSESSCMQAVGFVGASSAEFDFYVFRFVDRMLMLVDCI